MKKNIKEKTKSTKPKQEKTVLNSKRKDSDKKKVRLFSKKSNVVEDKIDFNDPEIMKKIKATDIVQAEKLKEYIEGDNMPKFTLNYLLHVYQTEVMKASVILVRMYLRNGNTASFYVNTDKPCFFYQKGAYIIDSEMMRDDVSSGHSCLTFHQQWSMPISLTKDIERVKQSLYDNPDVEEIIENTNPRTLLATIKSTLIQQVMAGGLLDKQIRSVIIIMVINLVLMIILLIGAMINGLL